MTISRSWYPYAAGLITGGLALMVVWFALHYEPTITRAPYREMRDEATLRRIAEDVATVARGRELFQRNCTLCHGTAGQGQTGPNLRDDYWLKGSDLQHICESIANGNPAKGMAAWSPALTPDELVALSSFIVSLHGTEDGTGRPPEGVHAPMEWKKK